MSPGAVVLAAALPLLLLHRTFQPSVDLSLAGTSVTAYLSDFAVAAVVVAALAAVVRARPFGLREARSLWLAGGLLALWIGVEVVHGGMHAAGYARTEHAITAAKFVEYMLLAPAVVALLRRRADGLLLLWTLALWSAAATIVGVAQFLGAGVALAVLVGTREASFLGYSDFTALSVVVALVGLVALCLPELRLGTRLGVVALVAGGLGTILGGALAGVAGFVAAAALLLLLLAVRRAPLRRATLVTAGAVAVVALGAAAIRGNDLQALARFLGASTETRRDRADVQTYSQRSLLSWIGYRIWRDDPVLGVGWEGSAEPANFEPVLPAAHARFPDLAPLAFPSAAPGRRWGVQNAWVQALADLGIVGFALWVATFAAAARLGFRRAGGLPLLALLGTVALAFLWAAQGFYAGIPLDALTALVFGLAAVRTVDA